MFLEVFAKERLVGEVHLFGYLFDALGGALHHDAQLQHHIVVNPAIGCPLAYFLDNLRQIFGCNSQLTRIPGDTTLRTAVIFHQFDKARENVFCSFLGLDANLLELVDDITQVVEHCQQ